MARKKQRGKSAMMTEQSSSKPQKQKLTLGVSSGVIDRAKAAGINISEITEQLLTAITFDPKGNTADDVLSAYQVFFDAIKSLLTKYGASIKIGHVVYSETINGPEEPWGYFAGKDGFWKTREDDDPGYEKVELGEVIHHLYNLNKILENLINSLTDAAQTNKNRLAQLDFARVLVKTLSEDEIRRDKK